VAPPSCRLLTLVGAVLVAVAALQSAGASTATSVAGRVGLNTHLVWVSQSSAEADYTRARRGGIEWVREEFPWRVVEPQRGSFAWSKTDSMMTAASRSSVNVLGILAYSAPWASSDPSGAGNDKYPPSDAADYGRYAAAVVARYGPGGSFWVARPDLVPRPLTAVQIWNEPWGHWFWKPNPSPAAYAKLVRAAATAIRAANPNVAILVSGDILQVRTDGAIVDWLKNLRAADPGLSTIVDAYSVHPYPYPRTYGPDVERTDPRWDYRRVELTRQIDPSLPIWITEVGWATASTSDSVSEATQAKFVVRAVERALGEWGSYVQRVFVYSFDRDSGNTSDREGYYGLLRQDGSAKPSWTDLEAYVGGAAAVPFEVASSGPVDGQPLQAPVAWEAFPSGATVDRVEFLIDGSSRWTGRSAPYRFNGDTGTLDPASLGSGSHTLSVVAYAADGRVARSDLAISVVSPFVVTSSGPVDGQTLSAPVAWEAQPNASVDRIGFAIDGSLRWTDRTAPFRYGGDTGLLDPAALGAGTHELSVVAFAADGRTASVRLTISVLAPFAVSTSGVVDGQSVNGKLVWEAVPSGAEAKNVTFWIDGAQRWADAAAPFRYGGDSGTLDTSTLKPGRHRLAVVATAVDGSTAQSVVTVDVVRAKSGKR